MSRYLSLILCCSWFATFYTISKPDILDIRQSKTRLFLLGYFICFIAKSMLLSKLNSESLLIIFERSNRSSFICRNKGTGNRSQKLKEKVIGIRGGSRIFSIGISKFLTTFFLF